MSKTMKAIVAGEDKKPHVRDVNIPELKPTQALLKMRTCGLCHTDLHVVKGDFGPVAGRILGHEGVGIVTKLGSEAGTNLKVGDRVVVPWLGQACGHCEFCTTGRESLCREVKNFGYSLDGAMAEYCAVPANFMVKVPDGLSDEVASTVACAGITASSAIKNTGIVPGQTLVISGTGGLGLWGILYAKRLYNVQVIALDFSDAALEKAKALGADHIINLKGLKPEEARDKIRALTGGTKVIGEAQLAVGGADAAVVFAPAAAAFGQAVSYIKAGGTVACVGLPVDNMQFPVPELVLNGKKVVGSLVGTRQDMRNALKHALEFKASAPSKDCSIDEAPAMFEAMAEGKLSGRVVIKFND